MANAGDKGWASSRRVDKEGGKRPVAGTGHRRARYSIQARGFAPMNRRAGAGVKRQVDEERLWCRAARRGESPTRVTLKSICAFGGDQGRGGRRGARARLLRGEDGGRLHTEEVMRVRARLERRRRLARRILSVTSHYTRPPQEGLSPHYTDCRGVACQCGGTAAGVARSTMWRRRR